MTARPIDPDSRRRPASAVVALVLLLAMVMAAGCIEQAETTPISPAIPLPTIAMSDRELAEQAIADAEEQIDKTDAVIGWFKGNASTRDDSELFVKILPKREIAVSYLVTAEDEITNGNFVQARIKAQEAYAKANESYNDALERQRTMFGVRDCGGQQTGSYIVIIIISVILTSILPALLVAYTYSLFKTILIPEVERFRQCTSRLSDYHIFAGAWTIYSAVLFIAVMTKQLSISHLSLFGTTVTFTAFWSGLVIITMIISVLVLGLVIRSILLTYLIPGQHESGPDRDTPVHYCLNITVVGEILVVIVLLFLMFFVIRFAFVIKGPFVLCM